MREFASISAKVVLGLGLLRLSVRMVSPDRVDGDTYLTLYAARSLISDGGLGFEQMHLAHPLGAFIHMWFLASMENIGFSPIFGWVLLLLALLVGFVWWILKNASLTTQLAVGLMFFAFPVSTQFVGLEEEGVGILLFATFITVKLDKVATQSRFLRLILLLACLWHFQYFFVLFIATVADLIHQAFIRRGEQILPKSIIAPLFQKVRDVTIVIPFLAASWIFVGLSSGLLPIIRYNAPEIWDDVSGPADLLKWIERFLLSWRGSFTGQAAPTANILAIGIGIPEIFSLLIPILFLGLFAALLFQSREHPFLFWSQILALIFPFLYEPESSERWTMCAVVLSFSLVQVAVKKVSPKLPKDFLPSSDRFG